MLCVLLLGIVFKLGINSVRFEHHRTTARGIFQFTTHICAQVVFQVQKVLLSGLKIISAVEIASSECSERSIFAVRTHESWQKFPSSCSKAI